jgi:hypothetical protein
MNHGAFVDTEFRGANPSVLSESERTNHKRIRYVSASRNLKARNAKDDIGFAQLPTALRLSGLYVIDSGPFHRTAIDPCDYFADLCLR